MRVEHEGLMFSLPSDKTKIPVEAMEAWEEDKFIVFVRSLIGPEAWAEFKATGPDMAAFGRLAKVIGDAYGFAGESLASRDSSVGTAGPSKPTSNTPTVSPSPPVIQPVP